MAYKNTFIHVSEDCPVDHAEIPKEKNGKKPAHLIQYELLNRCPYKYDHEHLIFDVYLQHKNLYLAKDEEKELWAQMFSKGHPCLRASALIKRYGFGAHYDEEGKIALYPMESEEYRKFAADKSMDHFPGMKTKR